jgi:hypothetical protein
VPEGTPLDDHEAPVSLTRRFDESVLMAGNHDEAMRRRAHSLVFLQVEPDGLEARLVSTLAEEFRLLPRCEQRRDEVAHTFIDFPKEDVVATRLLRANFRQDGGLFVQSI